MHLLVREMAVLPHLAERLPLPIPAPCFFGVGSEAYPQPFAGYERIAGKTACSVTLRDDDRASLVQPLASFLRALHDLEPDPFVALSLPGDEIGRLDHIKRLPAARDRLAALAIDGAIDSPGSWLAWMEANPPSPLDAARRSVVHGDLYSRHVLIGPDMTLTGVIDWGDMHHGDPAIDIAIAHLMLPGAAHAAFENAYGPIDDRTWNAARYRAIYSAILVLDYGEHVNDAGMVSIGHAALRLMKPGIA